MQSGDVTAEPGTEATAAVKAIIQYAGETLSPWRLNQVRPRSQLKVEEVPLVLFFKSWMTSCWCNMG